MPGQFLVTFRLGRVGHIRINAIYMLIKKFFLLQWKFQMAWTWKVYCRTCKKRVNEVVSFLFGISDSKISRASSILVKISRNVDGLYPSRVLLLEQYDNDIPYITDSKVRAKLHAEAWMATTRFWHRNEHFRCERWRLWNATMALVFLRALH